MIFAGEIICWIMNRKGMYSSGEFAEKAHVTLRTIRYYDKMNLLKPSMHTEAGARLYSDQDFAKLQQILLFKYLGFSLEEIREMTLASADPHFLNESLKIQKRLLQERQEELQSMILAVDQTSAALEQKHEIDWEQMLNLIHLTDMETELRTQYQNATNINARIALHRDFSVNPEGWFPWLFRQMPLKPGMKVLELGCGNGALWLENLSHIPSVISILLSDSSEGMVREVQHKLSEDQRFSFQTIEMDHIPYPDQSFDLVIANHVLFYSNELDQTLKEIRRVLKPEGTLAASTYGAKHMKEITQLVQEFNPEIHLAAENLYDQFGLENGEAILKPYFGSVISRRYEDSIEISEADPLISYILSCHGNQNRLLLDHYKEFREFVQDKVRDGFHITKDAGVFLARDQQAIHG